MPHYKKLIWFIFLFLFLGFLNFLIDLEKVTLFDEKNELISNKSSSELNLGQSMIVGIARYNLTENEKRILEKIKPAGIIFYARNFQNESQFKELINLTKKIVGDDCFLMIDEEPEGAERLGVFKKSFVSSVPNWETIKNGVVKLSSFGLNTDLAPIADFGFNHNTFIRKRIPVDNIDDLKNFNASFIQILHQNKVMATLKHFPGMGFFNDDPHLKIPENQISENDFNKSLEIFKNGIDAGADFVMTAHAFYNNIDTENMATFSQLIIKDLLINNLNFKGLIITDDLSDMPVTNSKLTHTDVGIKALRAGNNLITFSHQLERTEIIYDDILEKSKTDPELATTLQENYLKVSNFKKEKFE